MCRRKSAQTLPLWDAPPYCVPPRRDCLQCWQFPDISHLDGAKSVSHVCDFLSLARQSISPGPLVWYVVARRVSALKGRCSRVDSVSSTPMTACPKSHFPLEKCHIWVLSADCNLASSTSQYHLRQQGFSPRNYCPRQPVIPLKKYSVYCVGTTLVPQYWDSHTRFSPFD